LWVGGKLSELRGRHLDVLKTLLEAGGEPVRKEKLMVAAWNSTDVSDESLAQAVRKVRQAIGGDRDSVILTITGIGYQIVVPVVCTLVEEPFTPEFHFASGDFVPAKEEWRLLRPLDRYTPHWVWLAEHVVTHRACVFKFAEEGVRFDALQRELTAARLLERRAHTPERFIHVIEWRLTTRPYFLMEEYGGTELAEWVSARHREGFSREDALALMADLCDTVEEAHTLGLIHNDIKPSNILLTPKPGEQFGWSLKLVDFGVATLLDLRRLAESGVTNHGFSGVAMPPGGSAQYRAPEVAAGNAATPSTDVFALGVLLFQILTADFSQMPLGGWENRVDDPLLRMDIADAIRLDPTERISRPKHLAQRLRSLAERRAEAERQYQRDLREARANRLRAAQPYLYTVLALLLIALGVSLWAFLNARRQQRIATEVNQFLTEDLLRLNNPDVGSGVSQTLNQAIENAIPEIDKRFSNEPTVAASIHDTIALSMDNSRNLPGGSREYTAAAADWIRAEGPLSQSAIFDQMQLVFLMARSFNPSDVRAAKQLLEQQLVIMRQVKRPQPRVLFVADEAQAIVALASNDPKDAETHFRDGVAEAVRAGDALPKNYRLSAQERLCATQLRIGKASEAEPCFRELMREVAAANGTDTGAELTLNFNLAQALLMEKKYRETKIESDSLYPRIVKQFGPDNELTSQLLGVRETAESQLELWPEAIRDSQLIEQASAKRDPTGFLTVGALTDLGESECHSGAFEQGVKHAREAVVKASAPGQNPGMLGVSRSAVADCILLRGLKEGATPSGLAEVDHLLSSIDPVAVAAVTANPDWGITLHLSRAELAYLRKQYGAAEREMKSAKGLGSSDAEPLDHKRYMALSQLLAERVQRAS
jgi:serine/threonine protein kinase